MRVLPLLVLTTALCLYAGAAPAQWYAGTLGPIHAYAAYDAPDSQHLYDYHTPQEAWQPPYVPVYFNSLNAMQHALSIGEVNCLLLGRSTAGYMAERSVDYALKRMPGGGWGTQSYAMMVLEINRPIFDLLNNAIADIRADGTLNRLAQVHITEGIYSHEHSSEPLPRYEDALIIRIGVTGNTPPIDYVSMEDHPAGFSLALLTEIATRTHTNIEVLVIDHAECDLALASGKVDAVFLARTINCCPLDPQCAGYTEEDVMDGALLTESYYTDELVFVVPH